MTTLCERRFKITEDVIFWICTKILGNKKAPNKLRVAACDFFFSAADYNQKILTGKDSVLKKVV